MRKILSRVIIFVILINTLILNIITVTFAQSNVGFGWEKESTLNNKLEITQRPLDSDEGLIYWDITKIGGTTVTSGEYTLKYPISDGKEIEFKVNKKSNTQAIVTYKVNTNGTDFKNDVHEKNNPLLVYKDGSGYMPANNINFPPNDPNFKINNFFKNGSAKDVEFTITPNAGFNFQYQGNTVKFLWKGNLIYFVTNGISQGNIYNFDLKGPAGSNIDPLKIFTGINVKDGFISKPVANASDNNVDGKEEIDQTKRPITEYPGGKTSGMNITFNAPKEWDKATRKYKFLDTAEQAKKPTKVILTLGHNEPQKSFQVNIENIYNAQGKLNISPNITAELSNNNDKSNVTIKIRGVDPGVIYKDVTISAERNIEPFQTITSQVPIGKVYTYPEFYVQALGPEEFYIRIKPYKGYDGFYIINQGDTSNTVSKWAVHEEKNKGKEDIMIPISLSATSPQTKFFRVDFTFTPPDQITTDKIKFTSQVLKYKPYLEDIALSTPKNLEILESNIIRNENDEDHLYLKLKWDIGYESVLKNLVKQHNGGTKFKVKYLFNKGLKPDKIEDPEFLGVDLLFDAANVQNIEYKASQKVDGTDYFGELIEGETTTRKEIIGGIENNILEANVTFKIKVSAKTDTNKEVLQYPEIYFISTKGEYEIVNGNNSEKFTTGSSLVVTLTLNGILRIEVPKPQNIKIEDKSITDKGFKVGFDTLKYEEKEDILYNYNELMIKTIDMKLTDDSIKYNVYVTQDRSIFDEMIKYDKDNQVFPSYILNKIKKYDYNNIISENGSDIDTRNILIDGSKMIDYIRKNEVVKIANMKQNFKTSRQILNFIGLDENQTYYVIAQTIIEPVKKDGTVVPPDKVDKSKYSDIVTATTVKDEEIPGENEKVPSAPNRFEAKEVKFNSANLIWDRVIEVPEKDEKSTLEYQFIKVRGEPLDDVFLKSKDTFDKTWDKLSDIKTKEGLKTSKEFLYEYDKDKKAFSDKELSKDRYDYISWTGSEGNILDLTLSPNQIYYYYIRTVRVVDGEDQAYSVWVPLSLTTKNAEAPKNLRVELKAEYNKKSEVVISFDIPKMDLDLIGKDYEIQYSLKKDMEPWSEDKNMEKNKLTFKDNPDGSIKVTYKITGLKSGSMYTIRVRLFNRAMNSASIYSNEVEHRTDSDNTENDYDQDVENWDNNFKDLINKLKNESYWFAKNNSSDTVVYYRPQYFDSIIDSSNNSIIELAAGVGGSHKEYYLPASSIIKSFDANKGFKIVYNNSDFIFSAKSINPYENQEIKKITEEIKSKEKYIKDYFIKITVNFNNSKYNINRVDTVSPVTDFKLEVIGTKDTIIDWDEKMIEYIDELLSTDEFSLKVKEKIKDLVKKKTDNATMVIEIGKILDTFKAKFGDKLNRNLSNISRKTLLINNLDGNVIFAHPIQQGFTGYGYKRSLENWNSITISEYSGKKAIYIREIGAYVFTAKKLVINGAGNLPDGNIITEIVSKYGLEDFLGTNGNINLKSNLSRNMAVGSLARISGASKTQDPIEFFKSKGITLTTRNSNQNITSEEAVYLIMKVYEMRSGKGLETIKIRNYKLTSNIKGISAKYKTAINASFNIGIYNNQNMNPKGAITVQEFLQSLANMSKMLGI